MATMNNMMSNSNHTIDYDASSITSEDSQEPYYHITTGKVVKAREAWAILAAENHPRYASASRRQFSRNDASASGPVKHSAGGGLRHVDNGKEDANNNIIMNDSIFRSSDGELTSNDDAVNSNRCHR